MKYIPSNFLRPIQLGIIEEQKSYWANHFYSVIECINSHKNLQYSPRNFETFPIWTLNDLRGSHPINFFDHIQQYIKNWGFQYFLVNFLNKKSGCNIVKEIVGRLEEIHNVKFSNYLTGYEFHISGNDSAISENLSDRFTHTFPPSNQFNELNLKKLMIKHRSLLDILEKMNKN